MMRRRKRKAGEGKKERKREKRKGEKREDGKRIKDMRG